MGAPASPMLVGVGDLTGGSFPSHAQGVSPDGSVVVGEGSSDLGQEAFIRDATHGMRPLYDGLVGDFGLDLTGWTLRQALDISEDGRPIVGWGVNPSGQQEGWIARIPEPSTALLLGAALAGIAAAGRRRSPS